MKRKFSQICKQTLSLCIVAGMLCNAQPVVAAEKPIEIYVNGTYLPTPEAPYTENGYTLVPMRAIFEELGAKVTYDKATKQIVAIKGQRIVTLTIGHFVGYVNGAALPLNVAPIIKNGTTMVPLRDSSIMIGANVVSWDPNTRTITIETDDWVGENDQYYEEDYIEDDSYYEDIWNYEDNYSQEESPDGENTSDDDINYEEVIVDDDWYYNLTNN